MLFLFYVFKIQRHKIPNLMIMALCPPPSLSCGELVWMIKKMDFGWRIYVKIIPGILKKYCLKLSDKVCFIFFVSIHTGDQLTSLGVRSVTPKLQSSCRWSLSCCCRNCRHQCRPHPQRTQKKTRFLLFKPQKMSHSFPDKWCLNFAILGMLFSTRSLQSTRF